MDFFELGWCETGFGVAVEDYEFVGDREGFEEPEDSLGAGLFEPLDFG